MTRESTIIAHRANIWGATGPQDVGENSIEGIVAITELCPDLLIEVDVWYLNNQWFLGHDAPQTLVSEKWLQGLASHLVMHAKNAHAMSECAKRQWHCFGHDEDRYVLTSRGWVWTYPDSQTPLFQNSVLVMPERIHRDITNIPHMMCTDLVYDLLCHRNATVPPSWWRENVRSKLQHPTGPSSRVVASDASLADDRCIALYQPLRQTDFCSRFDVLLTELRTAFPDELHYDCHGDEAHLHWTLLQTRSFPDSKVRGITADDIVETHQHAGPIMQHLPRFQIFWVGLAITPTGLILLGLPTYTDLNTLRDQIRASIPKFTETYRNELVHASILRFRTPHASAETLQHIQQQYSHQLLGVSTIDHIYLRECSWSMNPTTLSPQPAFRYTLEA